MQTQPISPYGETALPGEQQGLHSGEEHDDHTSKKKSMLGKVKDKAKKLKTKLKSPKSHGAADNHDESSSVSSEDESGSEPQEQQVAARTGEEKDIVSTPGLKGDAYDAIPDPHVNSEEGPAGVQERFGQMNLGDETDYAKRREKVPSAPGQESAGVTPYLASHNLDESRGIPVEDGKNAEGKDLLVIPTSTDYQDTLPMDTDKTPEVSKSTDNTAAWYTPNSEENVSEAEQQKPLKDRLPEDSTVAKDGIAASAAAGAGVLGVESLYDDKESTGSKDSDVSGGTKSMLEQAKERIFGSSSKKLEDPQLSATASDQVQGDGSTPTFTNRAADTVAGFKDTIASKLGYGASKNLNNEGAATALQDDSYNAENKPALQKIKDSATGTTDTVTSKLGYGTEQQAPSEAVGEGVGTGDNKSYTQKAYDTAYGAKDAVAAKLGYGGTSTKDDITTGSPVTHDDQKSYLQKMQETAVGAKDAVALKLGYANRELPGSTEGAYSANESVPASTAARFHPGEEDRALSQLITEKMSTGAATVKDTLWRPFGASKSGPSTPTTTPPPSSEAAVAADPYHTTVTGTNDGVGEEKPGIVGKVTGAVTSLLGTSASGKKRSEEAAAKANADTQAAGVQ